MWGRRIGPIAYLAKLGRWRGGGGGIMGRGLEAGRFGNDKRLLTGHFAGCGRVRLVGPMAHRRGGRGARRVGMAWLVGG